ncbi:MAG: hypothetical protein RL653_302 [Pseudomonadota bacterium]|jgi:hypothetical protein
MAETLCPACSFTEIPDGAEECPRCGERFAFVPTWRRAQTRFIDRQRDSESLEMTAIGGAVAGELSFHPGPAAGGFCALALAWFVRASGWFGQWQDDAFGYLLALLGLAAGTGLLVGWTWGRRTAQAVAACSLLLALGLGGGPTAVLYAVLGAACLASVVGEPSATRRSVVLGVVLSVSALCVASLVLVRAPATAASPAELEAQQALGVSVRLPAGMAQVSPAALAGRPAVPTDSLTAASVAFTDGRGGTAVLSVSRDGAPALSDACQAQGRAHGAGGPGVRLQRAAPPSLGQGAVVLELALPGDEVALLACARRPDGRTVSLLALGAGGKAETAGAVLDAVGAGLSLK